MSSSRLLPGDVCSLVSSGAHIVEPGCAVSDDFLQTLGTSPSARAINQAYTSENDHCCRGSVVCIEDPHRKRVCTKLSYGRGLKLMLEQLAVIPAALGTPNIPAYMVLISSMTGLL